MTNIPTLCTPCGEPFQRALTDRQWSLIEPHLPGKASDPGATAEDNRHFVEAVLWIVRASATWRDLPPALGKWNSVFTRFSRWSRDGVWWSLFRVLADDLDFEYAIVDCTIVQRRQPTGEARGLKIAPGGLRLALQNSYRPPSS